MKFRILFPLIKIQKIEFALSLTSGNETRLLIITPETDKLFSYSGNFEIVEIIVANSHAEVSVDLSIIMQEYSLGKAYPNPFNPVTIIPYSIPATGPVTIKIFDLNGRELETLLQGTQNPGSYHLEWNATSYSSGVYFIIMASDHYTKSQKLMLVK